MAVADVSEVHTLRDKEDHKVKGKEEDHVEVVSKQVCRLDEEEQVKLRQEAQPELEDTEHLTKALMVMSVGQTDRARCGVTLMPGQCQFSKSAPRPERYGPRVGSRRYPPAKAVHKGELTGQPLSQNLTL